MNEWKFLRGFWKNCARLPSCLYIEIFHVNRFLGTFNLKYKSTTELMKSPWTPTRALSNWSMSSQDYLEICISYIEYEIMPKVCYRTCFQFYLSMHFTSGRVLSCFGRSDWNFSFSIMFSVNNQEGNCSIEDLRKKKIAACVEFLYNHKVKKENLAQYIERCSVRIQLHRSIELMPNR